MTPCYPTPPAPRAVLALRGLIARGVSPAWVTAADEELTRRAFQDGRAIFLRNWPYAMDLFQLPDSPVRGRVGIASLPRLAPDAVGAGASGGAHLGIYRGTRHREAAVALVRFLTSEAAERAMVADAALSPSRMALYHDAGWCASTRASPPSMRSRWPARPRPITPYYLMLSAVLQPEVSAVLVGVKTPRRAVAGARRHRARPDVLAARLDEPHQRADRRAGLLLLAPALVTLGGVTVYPALWVLWLSLQHRIPIFGISALRRPRPLRLPRQPIRASGTRCA